MLTRAALIGAATVRERSDAEYVTVILKRRTNQWEIGVVKREGRRHGSTRCAEPDDETTADFAAESSGTAPLAQARGLNVPDDVGAVNTICRQINAFRSQMAKHGAAAFVDG